MDSNQFPGGKEATVNTLSPITAVPASGPGALPGFETRCSCGATISGSLESYVQVEAQRHLDWHDRQPRTERGYFVRSHGHDPRGVRSVR